MTQKLLAMGDGFVEGEDDIAILPTAACIDLVNQASRG